MGGRLLLALCMVACVENWLALAENADIVGDEASPERVRRDAEDMADRTARSRRCTQCEVKGKKFDGHSRFAYEEGCTKYRCICKCDGSYQCPAQYSMDICGDNGNTGSRRSSSSSGSSSSSSPSSSGQTSSSGGSSSSSINSSSQGTRRSGSGCATCSVEGKSYPGNSYFDHKMGCIKYSNCACYCNGSWVCPPSRAQNVCGAGGVSGSSSGSQQTSSRGSSSVNSHTNSVSGSRSNSGSQSSSASGSQSSGVSSSHVGTSSGSSSGNSSTRFSAGRQTGARHGRQGHRGCQDCNAKGTIAKGNTRFELKDGCTEFKYCTCRCDGSWTCPARFAKNVCKDGQASNNRQSQSGSSSSVVTGNRGSLENKCNVCTIRGQVFRPNAQFQVRDGCVLYTQCHCFCNGSWSCPETGAREVCNTGEGYDVSDSNANCRTCEVKGKTFTGNQNFEITDGCIKYANCICRCDGSWECPAESASNICYSGQRTVNTGRGSSSSDNSKRKNADSQSSGTNSQSSSTNSQSSHSNSQTSSFSSHRSNSSSQSGSSSIHSSSGSNVRGNSISSQGSATTSQGSSIRNQDSSTVHQGRSTSNGTSRANIGGSIHQGQSEKDATASSTTTASSTCRICQVRGVSHPGNSFFEMRRDCLLYENCVCHCNGSWSCPGASARNVCNDQNPTVKPASTSESRCASCLVYGKNFRGNSYFDITNGCMRWKNCVCRCDGSWVCNRRQATNICGNGTATISEDITGSVSSGSAVSRTATDGSRQSGTSSGTRSHSSSSTRTGSSSNRVSAVSSSNTGENIRTQSNTRTGVEAGSRGGNRGTNRCAFCEAKNKVVPGNTQFKLTDGCIEYNNCLCRCDGSWNCPSQFARKICNDGSQTGPSRATDESGCSTCKAKGKIIKGNSFFKHLDGCYEYSDCRCNCDGSWECFPDKARDICRVSPSRRDGCSMCQSHDGTVHQPNSKFKLVDKCIEYNCNCHCNGSWTCPGKESRWVCTDKCLDCQVKGKTIANNSTFTHKTGCLEYTCNCHCNGSWSCPGRTARNTCPAGQRDGCSKCIVSGTEKYEGESDFVLKQGCLHYKCRCNCDGSYSCPGKDARNVCRGERLGGCRSCEVEKGVVHRGQSDFTLRRGCLKYQCRCNCDGSWECPAEKTRDACLGESLGGCRSCRVSDTEVYKGNTNFDVVKGCIHYKCSCNCDGSWSCPGQDARDVCKGEVPGGCKSCKVADNEFHPGESDFEMVKDCIHYKCRCACDGGYHCPGRTARRVCDTGRGTRRIGQETPNPTQCKACRVSDSEQYSDTSFTLERGCNRYQCQCNCNGSWECPADGSSNICNTPADNRRRTRCEPCKIGTSVYPGDSTFLFRRRCYQFDCMCNCGGRWTCNHRNPVNVCPQQRPGRGVGTAGASTGTGSRRGSTTRTTYTFYSVSEKGPTGTGHNSISSNDHEPLRTGSSVTADTESTNAVSENRNSEGTSGSSQSSSTSSSSSTKRHSSISRSASSETSSSSASTSESVSSQGTSGGSSSVTAFGSQNPVGGKPVAPQEKTEAEVRGIVSTRNRDGRTAIIPGTSLHEDRVLTSHVNSSTWVYADGVNRSEVLEGDGRLGGGYSVQIDQKYIPTFEYTNNQKRTKAEQLSDVGSASNSHYGSASNGHSGSVSNSHTGSASNGHSGSAGSTFYTASGTSSSSSSSSGSSVSSSSLSGQSGAAVSSSLGGTENCQKCLSDSKLYQPGAKFDMRRGCVVYKCVCLCSGSYRCRLVSDSACTANAKEKTCSNCVYNGMVFPGNMGFTIREGCVERECDCKCDGTHQCHTSKPISGCQFGVNQGSHSVGSFYPIQAGVVPARRAYITNSGKAVYSSSCPTCGKDSQNGQGGTAVYHTPVHAASGSRTNIDRHNSNVGGSSSTGGSRASSGVGFGASDSSNEVCTGCMIENELRAGNQSFQFTKDCIEFDCYCACGGSWKCSGRLALSCTPGFGPAKVPANEGCKNCRVQGTEYPSNGRFTLRQGCHEYQCSCNCDGSWSCPSQEPRNLCPPVNRPTRGGAIDPQTARGQSYVADVMNADEAQSSDGSRPPSRKTYPFAAAMVPTPARISFPSSDDKDGPISKRTTSDSSSCFECEVGRVQFPSNSKFMLREGCTQRICDCHCDGTWSCPSELNVNLCSENPKHSSPETDTCESCHIGDETFIGGRDFQYTSGCHQYTCECFCNGTHLCPREQVRNVCGPNSRRPATRTELETINAQGSTGISGALSVCNSCEIDGQTIQALGSFVRSRGCVESVCHCQCDGSPTCPPGGAVNVCELPDKKPMGQRPGCKIGRRVHFTRVFAHVENCIERTCVCHDDGRWSCKRSATDRKVC